METKHTPTPWMLYGWKHGTTVGIQPVDSQHGKVGPVALSGAIQEANAAFIVLAVNAYEANQKKITILTRLLEKATGWTLEEMAEAIAKAEGK